MASAPPGLRCHPSPLRGCGFHRWRYPGLRRFAACPGAFLADVDYGAVGDVWNGFSEDFVGEGRGISFAEKEEAEDVRDRISFGPLEVDVRDTSGGALDVDEQRGDGIGDHGAACVEDTVLAEMGSFHLQVLVELGGIGPFDFEEGDGDVFREAVELADEGLDAVKILDGGDGFGAAGNDADGLIAGVVNEPRSFAGEIDASDAKFGGARGTRDEGRE